MKEFMVLYSLNGAPKVGVFQVDTIEEAFKDWDNGRHKKEHIVAVVDLTYSNTAEIGTLIEVIKSTLSDKMSTK